MKPHTLYIGIDPGTHTGVSVWSRLERRLWMVDTMTITQAMKTVEDYVCTFDVEGNQRFEVVVYIEDARKRTWFGSANREKLQGAGSVKRDCSIWETFCEELGVECRKIAPRNNTTKLTASQFKVLTNWQGRTSDHARDATMLVFGR